jgi:hypothetical protein
MTVGAVRARPVDAGGDVLGVPLPSSPSTRTGSSFAPGATGGDADAVAGRGERDAAHVRAVAVAVLRRVVVLDEVVPGQDLRRQVRDGRGDARVDHGDHRARAGRRRVRGVGLDQVEVPLLAAARVVRGERGGRGRGQQEEGEHERAHLKPNTRVRADRKRSGRTRLYVITYNRMATAWTRSSSPSARA